MGGAFSPNTTEKIEPDLEHFVETFPLEPGRISHCSIEVGFEHPKTFLSEDIRF